MPGLGLRVTLMGGFRVEQDSAVVTLAQLSQRLIAFVALQGQVQRGQLAGTLWPDISEAKAAAAMRTAVWRIQRGLPGLLDVATHSLRLSENVVVDVDELVSAARGCRPLPPALDLHPASLTGMAAELLPGWDEEWVLFERERLRQLHMHALDYLAESSLDGGYFALALEAALASVRAEPLRESGHRLVIRVHLCEGNVSEAVRHYLRYADLLERELGWAPSAEMAALIPDQYRPRSGDRGEQSAAEARSHPFG